MVVKVLCSQNQLSYKYKNTFNCKVYCHKWQCQVPCVSAACPPAQKQNTDFPITGNAFSKCKSSTVFWVWDSITKILCMNFMIFLSGTTKNNQLTLFWHKFFFFFSILWVYHKYTYFWKNQHKRKGIQKEQCVACSWLSSCFTSHVHFINRKSFTKGHWVLSWWFGKNSTYPVFSSICC